MPRPRNPEQIVTVSVRLTAHLLARIDAKLKRLRGKAPGMMLTRADYIRHALFRDIEDDAKGTDSTEMQSFLATAGSWQDERSSAEIIAEIESSRRSRKNPEMLL